MTRSPTFQRRHVYGAVAAGALALAALVPITADAAQAMLRFDGGIGETPVSTVATANVVNGILPGGQPWVISTLHASVDENGQIRVNGRGLLLAGGNGIGTNAGQSVKAIVFCNGVRSETAAAGVPLEPDGDFRIEDQLVPTPAGPCATATLLITNLANRWFAAGIPK
ncbi:hypothetical protein [Ramlibacter sp.]|uniref:hypothetical protein n=1 Tax=Ramlibacter sp. TaxID=1917967 RepID=UPI00260A074D|nr:hypothetical protein [Ramlibacter sp.]MDB5953768.1 hypothetical protein [Ramlibacter sp.]